MSDYKELNAASKYLYEAWMGATNHFSGDMAIKMAPAIVGMVHSRRLEDRLDKVIAELENLTAAVKSVETAIQTSVPELGFLDPALGELGSTIHRAAHTIATIIDHKG